MTDIADQIMQMIGYTGDESAIRESVESALARARQDGYKSGYSTGYAHGVKEENRMVRPLLEEARTEGIEQGRRERDDEWEKSVGKNADAVLNAVAEFGLSEPAAIGESLHWLEGSLLAIRAQEPAHD